MYRLRQMSAFAHIVEAGSISAAAEQLGLSKSVVSQHLKLLEDELGVTLLKRTTRRQSLTEAGNTFYLQCKQINDLANSAWTTAKDLQMIPQGKLRITAPNALMANLITPVIAEMMQAYPQLQPELISSDVQLDLMQGDIDVAIRVGQSSDSNLTQKRIGQFRDVLCGHQSLLQRVEVGALPYVANAWQQRPIAHELQQHTGETLSFSANVRCVADSFHSCLALIEGAVGVGIIPEFSLTHSSSAIVPVFAKAKLPLMPIYALHGFGKKAPLAVKTFIDMVEQKLSLW